jgi:two-component system, OmpR family, response regulator ResD
MGKHILIVDDEAPMRELLRLYLKKEGYEIEESTTGIDAINKIREKTYSIVLLDIMMPGMGGFEVCREVRQFSQVPIIMLTARNQLTDKVTGLRIGADDYITKPFEREELLARIEAVSRRGIGKDIAEEKKDILRFNDLIMKKSTHQVFYVEKELSLTPKEYAILQLFLLNKGRVFSRDDVLGLIWGHDYIGDYRTVDTHIKNLRDKLTEAGIPGQNVIKTVWGVGYKCNESTKDK